MRLSDLMGAMVLDSEGHSVGRAFEVEARLTGPLTSEAAGNVPRVSSVLAGSAAFLLRLGFQRRDLRGPVGIRFLAHRAKGYRIKWDQIAALEERRLRLNCRIDELEPIRQED